MEAIKRKTIVGIRKTVRDEVQEAYKGINYGLYDIWKIISLPFEEAVYKPCCMRLRDNLYESNETS